MLSAGPICQKKPHHCIILTRLKKRKHQKNKKKKLEAAWWFCPWWPQRIWGSSEPIWGIWRLPHIPALSCYGLAPYHLQGYNRGPTKVNEANVTNTLPLEKDHQIFKWMYRQVRPISSLRTMNYCDYIFLPNKQREH